MAKKTKNKTKKGGMMRLFQSRTGPAAAMADSPVHGFGMFSPGGEMQMSNPLLSPLPLSFLPFRGNNNYYPTNYKVIGTGATKTVWTSNQLGPDWAFINASPEQLEDYDKSDMMNDYLFSLKLHELDTSIFPEVVAQWQTPLKFIYKKELCRQIDINKMDVTTLTSIIVAAIDLMNTQSLFTFDLKPGNVGFKDDLNPITGLVEGRINFIDFGLENSFKLKDGVSIEIKNKYVFYSILILLVYCLYNSTIPHNELKGLARKYIPFKYIKRFKIFNKERALQIYIDSDTAPPSVVIKKPGGYHPLFDNNIEVTFNFSNFNPSAPDSSILAMIVEPYKFLEAYGSTRVHTMDGRIKERNHSFDEIMGVLFS